MTDEGRRPDASLPRIAYMTGEYLRLSPFVFIYREISALRDLGFHVETFSVRGLSDPAEAVNPEQRREAERTFCVLPASPLRVVRAHLSAVLRAPRRYLRALRLARRTRQPGLRGLLFQIAYFVEAGIVAHRMAERRLVHLHNHFASSSGTVAMLAAEMGAFTFSISEHGPHIFFEPERWRLDEKFTRALFVSCISHFCRSQAMIFTPADHWHRLHIVHCGIEPRHHRVRRHAGPGARLLFTGRLSEMKGIRVLLEALVSLRKRWPEVVLDIAGDGPIRQSLEAHVAALQLQASVRFLGFQSSEQIRDRLAETDVFVLPSFAEGVPVVLMESMASGVPVVATRIAGIPELVEDCVSGLLVPPGDVTALVDAMERLLRDPVLRNRLGQAGRAIVEREYNTEREAAWLAEIMVRALRGERTSVRPWDSARLVAAPPYPEMNAM